MPSFFDHARVGGRAGRFRDFEPVVAELERSRRPVIEAMQGCGKGFRKTHPGQENEALEVETACS